ncbi:PREDICTED: lysM and putative peptidoglycan-binding domain-containing protein 2-like [Priapulus caudatus]|uniref:LysM and putative peptidoglycan-binding domain-containing protein 2-like n=1 Tax=Priapulus caudatus TaxID=37621 RepID=A0ABM1E6K1_PRICU|nr:PREDICTED: lysM and putative peptidoglycan-binding domain-containing protein 2-like [Priapulus caudatus]
MDSSVNLATISGHYIKHNVEPSDTLQGVALRYGVAVEKIKRANKLWSNDTLFLKTLYIPLENQEDIMTVVNGLNNNTAILKTSHTMPERNRCTDIVSEDLHAQQLETARCCDQPCLAGGILPIGSDGSDETMDENTSKCSTGSWLEGCNRHDEELTVEALLSKIDNNTDAIRKNVEKLKLNSDFPQPDLPPARQAGVVRQRRSLRQTPVRPSATSILVKVKQPLQQLRQHGLHSRGQNGSNEADVELKCFNIC